MTISGNYNTEEREVSIVKLILDNENIEYKDVYKYENADDGDVLIELYDNRTILIEVKEEDYESRFKKYGELGIDYISVFYFKDNVNQDKWKGSPKNPARHEEFLKDIDFNKKYKDGKVVYSKSNLWLFFVDDGTGINYWFFDGIGMTSQEFIDYLRSNCMFAVNNKPSWQNSFYDPHNSACFYIKPDNEFLSQFRVDIKDYLEN